MASLLNDLGNDPVKVMQRGASLRRLVALNYHKSQVNVGIYPRLVEPYAFSSGNEDTLVRCYQIDPEEGWRYFAIPKIEWARVTDDPFEPRRNITIHTGELEAFQHDPYQNLDRHWTAGRKHYREAITECLAEGTVKKTTLAELQAIAGLHNLDANDVRFVHAAVYHRCLGEILADGDVDLTEATELRFIHRVFAALGWSIGDRR